MRHFLPFTLILCAIVFQLLGCAENADIEIAETEEVVVKPVEVPTTETIITITPATIFERLQNQFAGRLDNHGDFTALRNITASRAYLDYLAGAYPTELPVKTLEEYFQVAPPNTERYTPFLKQRVDIPTEEDIVVMHRITVAFREANLILFKVFHLPQREELGKNVGLVVVQC